MKKYTFEDIEKNGLLLYRYYRGSHTYGTNVVDENGNDLSDWDEGGVYIEPINQVLGLGYDFQDEIADEKHDKVWYGLKKYMNLLCTSNPNILESLFVDDEFVIYEHPIITEIKKHRQEFVTKECFKSFLGYSYQQIKKATGYNKMCIQPIETRKWPLDFCYTTYKQGTANMCEWLKNRGLEQRFCGLVSLNNMPMCYGVFYDWGAHNSEKYNTYEEFLKDAPYYSFVVGCICKGIYDVQQKMKAWFENTQTPIGYRGIVRDDGNSDDIRCSSVEKDILPICTMCYNKNGFETHCRKYKEYQIWVEKRNPQRYQDNLGHNFDAKNVSHCFRLLYMGLEIAKTGEVHVNRRDIDAEFLRDIRNHKYDYDTLMKQLVGKKEELEEAIANSTIPDSINREHINNLLLDIRRKYQLNSI